MATIGKPKANKRVTGKESAIQRMEILREATILFSEKGYANTSMSAIARSVNLDQSSLYYWYKSKEDLLAELLTINRRRCTFEVDFAEIEGASTAKLFAGLFRIAYLHCVCPIDLLEIEHAAEKNPEPLSWFFRLFEIHKHELYDIFREAIEADLFATDNAWIATEISLSYILDKQHQYHRHLQGKPLFVTSRRLLKTGTTARRWSEAIVMILLGEYLGCRSRIEEARETAANNGWLELKDCDADCYRLAS